MTGTDIYQTLEDRGNYEEVERHGPYLCTTRYGNGNPKKGIKQPWLGEGYYFWDTRISDARWWGDIIYAKHLKGYVVCHTTYDQHSPQLFDMVGSVAMFDEFENCARYVRKKRKGSYVSFPLVLEYMKKRAGFDYKAIRVWPDPEIQVSNPQIGVLFPGGQATVVRLEKIQICFFDRTLLTQPFKIAEKHPFDIGYIV